MPPIILNGGDDDNDGLMFYVPFNIISVTVRWWKDDNERLCAMKLCVVTSWIPTFQPDVSPRPGDPKPGVLTT